jgi:hypothetical protein
VSLNGRKQGQGVGLGLAISRRIVEAHGGAIWVDEGRSGGARFQVLVPVYPSRWPELADSLTPGSGGESQASHVTRSGPFPPPREYHRPCLIPVRASPEARPILALSAMVLLAGCGLRATSPGEVVAPGGSESSVEPNSAGTEPIEGSPGASPATEALLEQGKALLLAGRFEEAVSALETYLVFGEEPEHRREAAWSLALVHLLPHEPPPATRPGPQPPCRDRGRASGDAGGPPGHLASGGASGGGPGTGVHLQEQEQTIRELNELVEQLKRIDLNRRPPGGG